MSRQPITGKAPCIITKYCLTMLPFHLHTMGLNASECKLRGGQVCPRPNCKVSAFSRLHFSSRHYDQLLLVCFIEKPDSFVHHDRWQGGSEIPSTVALMLIQSPKLLKEPFKRSNLGVGRQHFSQIWYRVRIRVLLLHISTKRVLETGLSKCYGHLHA